jgi:hypothetical protein
VNSTAARSSATGSVIVGPRPCSTAAATIRSTASASGRVSGLTPTPLRDRRGLPRRRRRPRPARSES